MQRVGRQHIGVVQKCQVIAGAELRRPVQRARDAEPAFHADEVDARIG